MGNNNDKDYDENVVYINPIIIKAKGKTLFLEGCESCIYQNNDKTIYYTGIVERPYMIEIEYFDLKGKKRKKTIKGFETTVFCHEYDHLNGVLHMDKTEKVWKMTLDEMKDYRSKNPYKIIEKDKDYKKI